VVAVAGRTWRLAPCLTLLVDEVDELAPRRSRRSDGSIGDAAHSARKSDHNPEDDPRDRDDTRWVTAVDLTHDPRGGLDVGELLDDMVQRRDPRLEGGYVIFKRRQAGPNTGWRWVRYGGDNPHESHGHVSVGNTARQRDDMRSWLDDEEFDMTLTAQDIALLRAEMEAATHKVAVAVLRAPEFNVDELEEDVGGLVGRLNRVIRSSNADLVLSLMGRGMSLEDAVAEAKRIENTPNAVPQT